MNTEKIDRFLELRSKGRTFAAIAAELEVTPRTLMNWQKQHRQELDNRRSMEIEQIQDKFIRSHEKELECVSTMLQRVEEVLHERQLKYCSTESLFAMACRLRNELRKIRIEPVFEFDDDLTDEPVEADTTIVKIQSGEIEAPKPVTQAPLHLGNESHAAEPAKIAPLSAAAVQPSATIKPEPIAPIPAAAILAAKPVLNPEPATPAKPTHPAPAAPTQSSPAPAAHPATAAAAPRPAPPIRPSPNGSVTTPIVAGTQPPAASPFTPKDSWRPYSSPQPVKPARN